MNQVKRCPQCEEPLFMCECEKLAQIAFDKEAKQVVEVYHHANHHRGLKSFLFVQLPTIIINRTAFGLRAPYQHEVLGYQGV